MIAGTRARYSGGREGEEMIFSPDGFLDRHLQERPLADRSGSGIHSL
jgi:hypothetical protein